MLAVDATRIYRNWSPWILVHIYIDDPEIPQLIIHISAPRDGDGFQWFLIEGIPLGSERDAWELDWPQPLGPGAYGTPSSDSEDSGSEVE